MVVILIIIRIIIYLTKYIKIYFPFLKIKKYINKKSNPSKELNLVELEEFIEELNRLLAENKGKPSRIRPPTIIQSNYDEEVPVHETLTETEAKVFIKISNYFRVLTITVPNLTVAYEIWLKGILQLLLDEVGLTFENWDRICSIGDQDSELLDRVDTEWTMFLGELRAGHINPEVWDLIQKGKIRSNELLKRRMVRKKRSNF